MKNERQFVYALIDDQDEIRSIAKLNETEYEKESSVTIGLRIRFGWRWEKLSNYPVAEIAL